MELGEWLDQGRGRLTQMAAHFDVSMSAVSQWRLNGVPLDRMRAVSEFTEGAVTLDDMVPGPAKVSA